MGLCDGPIIAGPSQISNGPIHVNLNKIEKLGEESLKLNISEVPTIEIPGPKWMQLDKEFKVKDSNSHITHEKRKLCKQNTYVDEEISRAQKRYKGYLFKNGGLSKKKTEVAEQPCQHQ